ncbi:hypothetical protein F5Y14DRAFT_57908 [Nemania sp. NC0429]|nr:hypothetical protein F5Y14DRAFT_57908 [Nemania sp. NC0429]
MATVTQIMQSSNLTAHSQSAATTAPVREHVCLFTHDLRRKQKRWQDGRLKYHTFNRRVMVYDERGNFIGDTHWREDYDLADGDDLELDRGSIIIQVGECVGSRDQDLSDLIDKRAQERAQRHAASVAAAARRPPTAPVTPLHVAQSPSLPHKHLHAVIGTPSGHHGRAVLPTESPYEERRQRQAQLQSDDTRPAKRQRRDRSPPSKSGYAQNLFGATLTLSGRPSSQASVRYRPLKRSRDQEEELTSPPSSTTSNHNDEPAISMDKPQTTTTLANAHTFSSRQAPLPANHARISTENSARRHDSMISEHSSHINLPDLPDELGKTPSIAKKRLKPIVNQAREKKTNHSVLDVRSANQKIRKPRGTDEALQKVDTEIHRSAAPLTTKVSNMIQDDGEASSSKLGIRGHTSQDADVIDITRGEVEIPRPQHCRDELRTELKIKPRKKRGLLMVSERDAARNSSRNSEPSKMGPDVRRLPSQSTTQSASALTNRREENARSTSMQRNESQENVPQGKRIVRNDNRQKNYVENASDDNDRQHSSCFIEDDEIGGMQYPDPHLEVGREAQLRSIIEQGDTPMAEMQALETGRRLRPRKQLSTERSPPLSDADNDHESLTSLRSRKRDDATIEEKPAPRLAKLARKSIKSREVIGYIFSDEPDPSVSVKQDSHAQGETGLDIQLNEDRGRQHHQPDNTLCHSSGATHIPSNAECQSPRNDTLVTEEPIMLRRQHSGQPTPPNPERSLPVQSEEVLPMVTTTTTKQHIPPIINPATRGRKAAKPSDAAGQMPKCPLPVELVRNPSLHQHPRKRNVQGNPDTDPAIPMPGFSRANGGPWSREAHDLFDFKRPS